jgi:site-specific DNA recombinase
VIREYSDNNISASSGALRPEYHRLLADLTAGLVDAVAVYDLDRLTRRPIELESFVNTCDRANVTQLAFVGGGIDMGTGDGLLIARIKGAFAAEEARKTSQRGKRKKLELAQRGLPSGGGYTGPSGSRKTR